MADFELIPHLFRTEYRKIVSVLSKRFGFNYVEIAEDITSDTFLTAAQTWPVNGLPPNPVAWLHLVARNKARNYLERRTLFENRIIPELKKSLPEFAESEIDLSPQNIHDSQLQMMFAICHPSISPESQIGLSLRILCGFGIDEIADAFLTNRETINKRLMRAREKLRSENIQIEMPELSQIGGRLENVLTTIYLLFNEGYYSQNQNQTIRKDLCLEAMRLCSMLIENKATNTTSVNALLALMCFHASRLDARTDVHGDPVLYEDQDESLWNPELISRGAYFLQCAASGNQLSKYHLEAAIAFWATQKKDSPQKWETVERLYAQLLTISYSPSAALHRVFALSKTKGNREAIGEAEKLNMKNNPLYNLLLGELYTGLDAAKASDYFHRAYSLAKTETGKKNIQRKLDKLK